MSSKHKTRTGGQKGAWPNRTGSRPAPSRLSYRQIMEWAKDHHRRTGLWPAGKSGPVLAAPDETWNRIENALRDGFRGLPGGSSLAKLIGKDAGGDRRLTKPKLTPADVLRWADAYHQRTGKWPTVATERIPEAPGDTWSGVRTAMIKGLRGWRPPTTLARFLASRRGIPYHLKSVQGRILTKSEIIEWARLHFHRMRQLPSASTGPAWDSPGETWEAIDAALRYGTRGLPGGETLATLLRRHFKIPLRARKSILTQREIIEWARAHCRRTGQWPTVTSGKVRDAPGETWSGLNAVLQGGFRGLPGGSSLARLLESRLGVPIRRH